MFDHPGIFLEDLRNARITSQDGRIVERDFEMGTVEYEARVLDIRPDPRVQKRVHFAF